MREFSVAVWFFASIALAPYSVNASECGVTINCCTGAHPAYCDDGEQPLKAFGTTLRKIPIYLVEDGPDFGGVEHSHAINHLRAAIRIWHETSGGDFFPYYAGTLSSIPSWYGGQVVIDDTTNCDACEGDGACEKDISFLWDTYGVKILFQYPNDDDEGCPRSGWWSATTDNKGNLAGVFVHELGHAFTLGDEYLDDAGSPLCPPCVPNSAMAQGYPSKHARTLTRRDITVLNEVSPYGLRREQYESLFSYDGGATWASGLSDDVAGSLYQGSLGVGPTTREVLAIATFGVFSPGYTNALVGHTGFSFSTVIPILSSSRRSWDVAAGAVKSSYEYAIAYRVYEYEDRARKGVALSSYSSERGWVTRDARIGSDTVWTTNDGVSVTYDANTDLYVAAASGDQRLNDNGLIDKPWNDDIILAAWDEQTGERQWGALVPEAASRAHPAIACGDHGYYNCMLAWQNKAASPTIDYLRFRPTSVGFEMDPGGIRSLGLHAEMPPTLTAKDDSIFPFMLGVQQGVTFYLYEYDALLDSWFHLSTPLYEPDGMLQPALGRQGSALMLRYAPL